jgi:hypothetical protein
MMVRNEDKIQARKKQIIDALKVRLSSDVYSRITVQDIAQESVFPRAESFIISPRKRISTSRLLRISSVK